MFGREYELLKKLLKYTSDDLILKQKLLFRMIDIKDKKIKEKQIITKEELKILNYQIEILNNEIKENDKTINKIIKIT